MQIIATFMVLAYRMRQRVARGAVTDRIMYFVTYLLISEKKNGRQL